jgi:site-specific recombinase XerD
MTFFTSIITDFIELRVSNGYKRNSYQYLLDFDRFVLENFPNASELDENLVLAWMQRRNSEKLCSQFYRAIKIRQLAKYIITMGGKAFMLPKNYCRHKTDFVTYILSDQELSTLFTASDNIMPSQLNTFSKEVMPIMLRLMYYCGLRPGESRCLKNKDIDLDNGIIYVNENRHHKGRYVPMSSSVTELCRFYANKLKIFMPESEFFFPNTNGKPYTVYVFNNYFKKIRSIAFPNSHKKITAYCLRHRFATAVLMKWLNNGIDINSRLKYLQVYMGHENIESTAYYIHLIPENIIRSSAIDWDYFNSLIPEV